MKPIQSITGYLLDKTFEKPSDNNDTTTDTSIGAKLQSLHQSLFFVSANNDSIIKICGKHVYATVLLSSLTLIGLVESFVRTSLFLMVKAFQFFVPKQHCENLNLNVTFPLYNHARFSIEGTMQAATSIVTQFLDIDSHQKIINKIINCTLNNYYARNLVALHFNGFDSWAISRNPA